jgi:mono/diheme cytochrome c family protein
MRIDLHPPNQPMREVTGQQRRLPQALVWGLFLGAAISVFGILRGWCLPQMMGHQMMGQMSIPASGQTTGPMTGQTSPMPGMMTGMMGPVMDQTGGFSWSQFQPPAAVSPSRNMLSNGKALYLIDCVVCHGDLGKGNGWRANSLYPKPRNFTRGIFRFKTTASGSLPTDRDLYRTISTGLQGTAMPAWGNLLTEKDRWALVAYLKTFSHYFKEDRPGVPLAVGVEPEMTPARVQRGKQLFAKAGCADCHGAKGYGDGYASKGMEDSFGVPIRPRNFHIPSEFKRGRTLRDVAWTVQTGNDGSPMPSFHGTLTNSQIWDLANYVISLDVEMPTFPGGGCRMMTTGMQMPAATPSPVLKNE